MAAESQVYRKPVRTKLETDEFRRLRSAPAASADTLYLSRGSRDFSSDGDALNLDDAPSGVAKTASGSLSALNRWRAPTQVCVQELPNPSFQTITMDHLATRTGHS